MLDEVVDLQELFMWLDVNGEWMQDGLINIMVYGVVYLISYLSWFFMFYLGDIILMGIFFGVGLGFKLLCYFKVGDIVELGIDGLGSQKQVCVDDD